MTEEEEGRGDDESTIFQNVRHNRVKVRKAYNSLIALGRENNISFEITVTDGWEIPTGLSCPLDVRLASGQFHDDIDDIFAERSGGNFYCDIQRRINVAHNRLVLRRGDGDGISIKVVATNMGGGASRTIKG